MTVVETGLLPSVRRKVEALNVSIPFLWEQRAVALLLCLGATDVRSWCFREAGTD